MRNALEKVNTMRFQLHSFKVKGSIQDAMGIELQKRFKVHFKLQIALRIPKKKRCRTIAVSRHWFISFYSYKIDISIKYLVIFSHFLFRGTYEWRDALEKKEAECPMGGIIIYGALYSIKTFFFYITNNSIVLSCGKVLTCEIFNRLAKWSESNQSNGDCRFIIFKAVVFLYSFLPSLCIMYFDKLYWLVVSRRRAREISIYGRAMQLRQMIINIFLSYFFFVSTVWKKRQERKKIQGFTLRCIL